MNEITQYIKELEAQYEEVKTQNSYDDSDAYHRGRESQLEDVISKLREAVEAFKKRINKQVKNLDKINDFDENEIDNDVDVLRDFTQLSTESNTLKKIVNEL